MCLYPYTLLSLVAIVQELLSDRILQQCYILSGKFNQDPLENFFGKVRQSGSCSGDPVDEKLLRRLLMLSDCKHQEYREYPQQGWGHTVDNDFDVDVSITFDRSHNTL